MSEKPEALRLADDLQAAVQTYPQMSEDEPGGYASEVDQVMDEAAAELRRLHAEVVAAHTEIGNQARKVAELHAENEANERNLCDLTDDLAKTVALLRQAQEALETDHWQKKMQASIDIKKYLESKA